MSHRFTRSAAISRSLLLVAGLLAIVASCENSRRSVVAPDDVSSAPFGGPQRAVVAGQFATFYIGAFVDDWPLFMGDRVPASLSRSTEVVFIFTNSGDKNLGMPYVTTREQGGIASMDSVLQVAGPWTCSNPTISGHPIRKCVKASAVAYFMRLPDGAPTGEGYGTRGSMAQLRDGAQPTITTIDSTTTYTSWADLVSTVRSIVDLEDGAQSAPYVEVNTFDYDRTINPRDHTDHLATADLVNSAAATRSWNLNWFVGFPAQYLAVNLAQPAHDVKQEAFYGYDQIVGGAGYGHPKYDSDVQLLLWRTYFRTTTSVPAPPPAAPSALQASVFSSTRTDLAWTNNTTIATSIDVERAPDVSGVAGAYAVVGTVGASATSYSVTGEAAGTRYWYRVRARNASDVSAYSNAVAATTLTPPAAPSALTAQVMASYRVNLAWTDNATGETGYVVWRAPDNNGVAGTFQSIATIAAGSVAYSDASLSGSTRYWYRVQAITATDSSPFSNVVSATTPVAPPTPTGFAATTVSASRIDLSWTDVSGEANYVLDRAPDNGGSPGTFSTLATLAANTVTYSDQALSAGTRYWYRLRATTSTDASAYTTPVSATTLAAPPAAPTGLAATAMSSTRIDLGWTDNSTNETGFIIERAPDNNGTAGTFTVLLTLSANSTSYSNTGLLAATRYWYRVRATNAAGQSAYTLSASATTLAAPTSRTDFFVHAHEDDWQLFMGDVANGSLQVATKVVFVYTSAGDANLGSAYWHLRETGAENAVDALLGGSGSWVCAYQAVNAHNLWRCTRGIAVSYFMRLPDGATSGEGFGGRGSMNQLRDGQRSTLAALDGSTTYTSWADLTNTMRAIVDMESSNGSAPAVEVHAPEYDRTANSGDHPDHLSTGDLIRAASASRVWNLNWYVGYNTRYRAINLSQAAHDTKRDAFYAYDYTVGRGGYGYSQFEQEYQDWLWRTYARREAH